MKIKRNKMVVRIVGLFILCSILIGVLLGVMYSWDVSRHTHIVRDDILHLPNQENFTGISLKQSKIGFVSLMKNPIDLPLWLKYHRNLGISLFFIRLEDSPSWEEYLKGMEDVIVEVGSSDETGNNYSTLIERQKAFANQVLKDTQKTQNIDWLIHIDADELLHGDISAITDLSTDIKTVKMVNVEAVFDNQSAKRNTCFSATKFLRCDQGAPCKSYVNGKSGGRTNMDGVYLAGPHDFAFSDGQDKNTHQDIPFKKLHILHFEGCSFGGWVEKYHHLSKNDKKDMPFPYYKESIVTSTKAYELYEKNKMPSIQNLNSDHVYSLYDPIKL